MKNFIPFSTICFLTLFTLILYSCQDQTQPPATTAGDYDTTAFGLDEAMIRKHIISETVAYTYIDRYKYRLAELPTKGCDPMWLKDSFNLPEYEAFEKDAIKAVALTPHAVNVRIYYGINDKGQVVQILFPVDADGHIVGPIPKSLDDLKISADQSAEQDSNAPRVMMAVVKDAIEVGQRYP